MKNLLTFLFVCWFTIYYAQPATGQSIQIDSSQVERIFKTSQLWGHLKYFHPFLPNDTIDWDLAYSEHILAIIQAHTKLEYEGAVQGMLDCLNDPITKVIVPDTVTSKKYDEKYPKSAFIQDSLLLISIRNYADLEDFPYCYNFFSSLAPLIIKCKGIIFDFRNKKNYNYLKGSINDLFSIIEPSLVHDNLQVHGLQYRYHNGFVPETGYISIGYNSGFYIKGERIVTGDKKVKSKPIIFIYNEASELPVIALSLQKKGMAEIISVGKTSDGPLVETTDYYLDKEIKAQIRLNKLPENQTFCANLILSNDLTDAEVINSAVRLIKNDYLEPQSSIGQSNKNKTSFSQTKSNNNVSENKYYPGLSNRLMAITKIWTVINYFFAYKDLMESDWNQVFKEFIPKIASAKDSLEYYLTIAEMYKYIQDGHGQISSSVKNKYFGTAAPPISVRFIDNQPVIINVFPDSIYPVRDLNVGDVILEVDDETASNRFERLAKYLSSSNESALQNYVSRYFLNGNDGTEAKIKINHNNIIKTVVLPRTNKYSNYFRTHFYYGSFREGKPITYLINNDIGYADLDRLTVDMVDKMFDDFKNTKSIIFDMRGYPNGTAWTIAPHLADKSDIIAAQFIRYSPLNIGLVIGDTKFETKTFFSQTIPKPISPKYNGKTVMLIDERTQSQAEHTGLFFKAANGTKFIGSQTAGANGDVTNFNIPGSITLNFTGQQVVFPNGKQLQKVGLIPDVQIKPTIKGIIEGKDEVLEKAVDFINHSSK
jgi:C-terminal processing protease CtpA/Prc